MLVQCICCGQAKKTAAINNFFFCNFFFPIYCCEYTKTAANDKQQICFFPLVKGAQRIERGGIGDQTNTVTPRILSGFKNKLNK